MTSHPPHLLGLPRELRDMIYNHLSQEIVMIMTWPWRIQPTHIARRPKNNTMIHIPHAPLLSVLLTHSRIYAEYLTSFWLKKPVSITLDALSCDNPNIPIRALDTRAFTHIRRASLAAVSTGRAQLWQDMSDCAQLFRGFAPNLSVIHVYMHIVPSEGDFYVYHSRLAQFLCDNRSATRKSFLPPPPLTLARLPLRQRGEGFIIELDNVRPKLGTVLHDMFPLAPPELLAYVGKVGVYVFTESGNAPPKLFGEVNEVTGEYLRKKKLYPKELLEVLFKDEEKLLEDPYGMQGWREESGEELVRWMDEEGGSSV